MGRLWIALGVVVVFGFAVLGWIGTRIYQEMPPIPERVITTDGREIVGPGEIMRGQNVWQTMGGMEVGSVWGHGSYVAPDWTADWLHLSDADEALRKPRESPNETMPMPLQNATGPKKRCAVPPGGVYPLGGTVGS